MPPDDLTYPSPRRNGVDDSQALYSPSLDPIDPELHSSAESPSSLHSDEQLISDAPAELSNELCQIALDNPSNGLLDSYLDEEASLGFQEDFVSK
ncbi:unnamed protein product [Protopolystoma xenopodis]|uniref:Uncharacterized protein n=1 Tax=Protopolystoma xenopodis TaxID=117903 RepID=A0A448XA77_9PLAT|nr:unnamed protein product [Protopolystoma xenopodis]